MLILSATLKSIYQCIVQFLNLEILPDPKTKGHPLQRKLSSREVQFRLVTTRPAMRSDLLMKWLMITKLPVSICYEETFYTRSSLSDQM
jgi:hypothetical protein